MLQGWRQVGISAVAWEKCILTRSGWYVLGSSFVQGVARDPPLPMRANRHTRRCAGLESREPMAVLDEGRR